MVYLEPSSGHPDLRFQAIAGGSTFDPVQRTLISLPMLLSTLRAYIPSAAFVDVENPARFRCHTMIATSYRSGPVFLAGDAAHLCSPGQGHGMNCGLQDAFNLAWKLALVHQGAAHETLLDSYEIERRPAAAARNEIRRRLWKISDGIDRPNGTQGSRPGHQGRTR